MFTPQSRLSFGVLLPGHHGGGIAYVIHSVRQQSSTMTAVQASLALVGHLVCKPETLTLGQRSILTSF